MPFAPSASDHTNRGNSLIKRTAAAVGSMGSYGFRRRLPTSPRVPWSARPWIEHGQSPLARPASLFAGHRTPAQGAAAAVKMATITTDGPTGTLTDDGGVPS